MAVAVAALALTGGIATAQGAPGSDTHGLTTVEQRIVPGEEAGFRTLGLGPGEGYVVREEGIGAAQPGRERRRT